MKDANSYIDNVISMTEKLCRQIDDADTKWQLALIYNELAKEKVALLQSTHAIEAQTQRYSVVPVCKTITHNK